MSVEVLESNSTYHSCDRFEPSTINIDKLYYYVKYWLRKASLREVTLREVSLREVLLR